jgi:hypothetical protein
MDIEKLRAIHQVVKMGAAHSLAATREATEAMRPKTLDELWDHYLLTTARISANLVLVANQLERIEDELKETHDGFEPYDIS